MGRHANIAIFVPHLGCPRQCSFCQQRTITGQQDAPGPEDVLAAAETAAGSLSDCSGAEIAFFGGSFTAIDRGYMLSLLEAAKRAVERYGFKGVRCSTRPDAIDSEVLDILQAHRVTAVELGAQSMDDGVLRKNLRGHTAAQVEDASRRIHRQGFSLGLQMMTGLDGQDKESSLDTAARLAELKPECVRIYPTVVLEGTLLAERFLKGTYVPPSLEETVSLGARLLDFFEERQIPVIRLGLHASREVEWQMLAGGYHPALRELCEARRFLFREREALEGLPEGDGEVLLAIHPKDISKALGQKRENLRLLEKEGRRVRFVQDEKTEPGTVRVYHL